MILRMLADRVGCSMKHIAPKEPFCNIIYLEILQDH